MVLAAPHELLDLESLRSKRDTSPVWRDPADGVWNVYRYEDVLTVLNDYATFSSDFAARLERNAELAEGNILASDPPRHHQMRGLVSQAFSPRAIAHLEDRIEVVADDLLDALSGQDHIELVNDFMYPLPVTIIAEMLGVPTADRPRFKLWADALLDKAQPEADDKARIEAAVVQLRHFHDYLREKVQRRRTRLGHDLLSDLIRARIDDKSLTDAEIVGFATLLLIAGHITTTMLLGNALLCLDERPVIQAALRADPSALPTAIEETLRYRSPVRLTRRITTHAVEFAGARIPAGEWVNVWLLSANHDEREFSFPDDFIVDRAPNPHVAFGRGIHFCLGAPLARLEARVALAALLRRYRWLRVDPDRPPEVYASSAFSGVRRLDLQVS